MKSYTDLEQSKKLAEILPPESADQIWERIAIAGANLDVPEEMEYWHNGNMSYILSSRIGIPCWSLAALLSVIPDVSLNAFEGRRWYAMIIHNGKMIYGDKDNPIDACVEMILRLHEQKLL